MAIRDVVTAGYGNGTFNGTVALVVTRGYAVGEVAGADIPGLEYTAQPNRLHYTARENRLHYTAEEQ